MIQRVTFSVGKYDHQVQARVKSVFYIVLIIVGPSSLGVRSSGWSKGRAGGRGPSREIVGVGRKAGVNKTIVDGTGRNN